MKRNKFSLIAKFFSVRDEKIRWYISKITDFLEERIILRTLGNGSTILFWGLRTAKTYRIHKLEYMA